MGKSFTEYERNIIREKLIESCKECWNKYGYQKTNVSEMARMAGISTGAFYQFFQSKELLFMVTAQSAGDEILSTIENELTASPDKKGLSQGLKKVICQVRKMEWFLSLSDEIPVLMRKLSPEYMQQDFQNDMLKFTGFIEKYSLSPKKPIDEITTVIQLITVCVLYQNKLAGDVNKAMDFMIDTMIENLFD